MQAWGGTFARNRQRRAGRVAKSMSVSMRQYVGPAYLETRPLGRNPSLILPCQRGGGARRQALDGGGDFSVRKIAPHSPSGARPS